MAGFWGSLGVSRPRGGLWGSRGGPAHHVGAQVDAEDGDGAQGQGDVGHDEEQEGGDLGDVAGQGVGDGLLQVVEDQAACGEGDRGVTGGPQPHPPAPRGHGPDLPPRR